MFSDLTIESGSGGILQHFYSLKTTLSITFLPTALLRKAERYKRNFAKSFCYETFHYDCKFCLVNGHIIDFFKVGRVHTFYKYAAPA